MPAKDRGKETELVEQVRDILERINNEDRVPGESSALYEQLAETMDKLIEFRMTRRGRGAGGGLNG